MSPLRTRVHQWGSTEQERARTYPAQQLMPLADLVLHRAVDVEASAADTFRWLCQLKLAPYSYDWVDNLGRRSPRTLAPGTDELALGDRFMTGFRLVAFVPGESITLKLSRWLMTYEVRPVSAGTSRLVCVIAMRFNGVLGELLAWGDLVMIRKQLRTLACLAEQQGRSSRPC